MVTFLFCDESRKITCFLFLKNAPEKDLSVNQGLAEKTIRQGQKELSLDLADRPEDRIRLSGAGRPRTEKKTQLSKRS
jgi:hypothetical protein